MKKVCTKCKVEKELGDFHKNAALADGLTSSCKACHTAYYIANKFRIARYTKEYNRNNKEKVKACKNRWRKSSEKYQAYLREKRKRRKQKIKSDPIKWRAFQDKRNRRNKSFKLRRKAFYNEKARIRTANYRRANKDKVRRLRRGYLKTAVIKITDIYVIHNLRKRFGINAKTARGNPELIHSFRAQIKTNRLLRNLKKSNNGKSGQEISKAD